MTLTGEGGGILKQVDAVTTQGVARAAYGLDKPGLLEISVTSDPAMVSNVLQLDVSQSGAVAVIVVTPRVNSTHRADAPTDGCSGGRPLYFKGRLSAFIRMAGRDALHRP